jgi:hypothetical protein
MFPIINVAANKCQHKWRCSGNIFPNLTLLLNVIVENSRISDIRQAVVYLKAGLMLKKMTVISITIIILAAACQERQSAKNQSQIARQHQKINSSDSAARLIEYLKAQNLPTAESVEIWNSGFGGSLKITTAHYEIYSTLKEPLMLRDVPAFIETCFNNYQQQLTEPLQTNKKFTIYLFDNRSQWQLFTAGFAGRQAQIYSQIKAGAYYLDGACVAYNIGRERTFHVMGHECWHQFVDRLFKFRLPSWLNEGLATQFEANRYEKGLFYFEPAENTYRLDMLKKAVTQNQTIPLEKLLETDPGSLVGNDPQTSAFYSQCYALVLFLRQADAGNFNLLLTDGLEGKWPISDEDKLTAADRTIPLTVIWNKNVGPQLFKQYFGSDISTIEKDYLDFCKNIVRDK